MAKQRCSDTDVDGIDIIVRACFRARRRFSHSDSSARNKSELTRTRSTERNNQNFSGKWLRLDVEFDSFV